MGFALAEEFAEKGAEVTLVTGPTNLNPENENIARQDVMSANDMLEACQKYFPESDILVMAAAVADFKPSASHQQKIKKGHSGMELKLDPTPDILYTLSKQKKKDQILAGFALETENGLNYAKEKLEKKSLDLIILNSLQDKGAGFGTETNKITIIDKFGKATNYTMKDKREVAVDIVDYICAMISSSKR